MSKDSKNKDRDWALLNEGERVREKELRPSPQQRIIYFFIAVATTLGVIRALACFLVPFFFLCAYAVSHSGVWPGH
jgi:hypothetical protein